MNEILLNGCTPRPLASYLKAMGILRLVAEQKVPTVKGRWVDGAVFALTTDLPEDDLIDFFTKEYAPTPIVSPWNGGSGFYQGDASAGIDAIENSDDRRFSAYASVIRNIRSWPEMPPSFETANDVLMTLQQLLDDGLGGKKAEEAVAAKNAILDSSPNLPGWTCGRLLASQISGMPQLGKNREEKQKVAEWRKAIKKGITLCTAAFRGGGKEELLGICRSRLPDAALLWIDAAFALSADGGPAFGPILGTGGNEGRLDLSNNFMQRVSELLLSANSDETASLFAAAVFNAPMPGMKKAPIGQFDPGVAGGYNQGPGIEYKDFRINPWDFVLMLEGALVCASAITRRNQAGIGGLSAPWTVHFSPVGFASSEHAEAGRKETWLPLWERPARWAEIRRLFAEGRANVQRKTARSGLDFAKAVSTLGVDRGISGFERYAFLERRGQSYVALPAGRLQVRHRPELSIMAELDAILDRTDGFLRQFKTTPATFASARRSIDDAQFDCIRQPGAETFSRLLRAVGRMERLIAFRDRTLDPKMSRPQYGLSAGWITQADDGGPEIRIAAALAAIAPTGKVGAFRTYMAGTEPGAPWKWAGGAKPHWFGNTLDLRLVHLLSRRLMDAERFRVEGAPLWGPIRLHSGDVMAFLRGVTDDTKMEELLWAFTLIRWNRDEGRSIGDRWRRPVYPLPVSRTWALLKLLHLPKGESVAAIRREPRILATLRSGRIEEAAEIAVQRLAVSGQNPYRVPYETPEDPNRLAASLMIPVHSDRLKPLVLHPPESAKEASHV